MIFESNLTPLRGANCNTLGLSHAPSPVPAVPVALGFTSAVAIPSMESQAPLWCHLSHPLRGTVKSPQILSMATVNTLHQGPAPPEDRGSVLGTHMLTDNHV